MARPDETPFDPTGPPDLSPAGLADLSRLLGGLDLLDRLLRLPADPGEEGAVSLGRYRVLRRVGAGRFGVVFLAVDPGLGRRVVVKVPQPAVLADPEQRARFAREALAAGRLDHPGVVPVFDAGEDRGLAYLAAGLVEGPSLADWLAARPAPPDPRTAAHLVELLALAVHHAHERGVLHCDLKPANVLLDPAAGTPDGVPGVGAPRVTDFGLARLLEADPALTRTFQVAGTPLYMAPEQARGDRRALTARTDLYALGAILYELLTGRPPFAGGDEADVRRRVVADPPAPPDRARPGVPKDLAAICLRCLEKDPGRRYASAAELADDLRRFLAGRPVRARRPGAAERLAGAVRRHPVVAALGGLALALGAALAMHLAQSGLDRVRHDLAVRAAEREAAAERFHAGLAEVRARRADPYPGWGQESLAQIRELAGTEPAGGHLADLRSEAAAALAAVDLRPVRSIAEGFATYNPAFSPDGTVLAAGSWRPGPDGLVRVRLYDPGTGVLRRELAFAGDADWAERHDRPDGCRSLRFSPDGRWLVAGTRRGRLVRWDLHDPAAPPVGWAGHADDGLPPQDLAVESLTFAAGGGALFTANRRVLRRWAVRAGWAQTGWWRNAGGPRGTPAVEGELEAARVAGDRWRIGPLDTGEHGVHAAPLYTLSRDGRLAAVDFEGLRLAGLYPGTVTRPLGIPGRPRAAVPSVTDVGFGPDAAVLVTAGEHDRRVKLWDVAAGVLAADRPVGEGSGRFAFAPDGRHLAVAEDERVVVYEVTGRVRETLAVDRHERVALVAVTPDGRTLLTAHNSPESPGMETAVWDVRPDRPGGRTPGRAFEVGTSSRVADCTPDGRTLGLTVSANGARQEWVAVGPAAAAAGDRLRVAGVSDLRFGPDGRLWATDTHQVRVWTPPGWAEERPLENDPAARAAGMVFRAVAPGRSQVLVGRRDGAVFRLAGAGPPAAVWRPFAAPVVGLAMSADEARAAVGGETGEVALVDLPGGRVTPVPAAHRGAVRAVAFGPGGWVATGSADGTVKLWTAAGAPVMTLRAGGEVRKLAVSADGDLLTVLVDGERGVRRWRLDLLRAELARLGLGDGW